VPDGVHRGLCCSFPVQVRTDVDVNVADDPMLERTSHDRNATSGSIIPISLLRQCLTISAQFFEDRYVGKVINLEYENLKSRKV